MIVKKIILQLGNLIFLPLYLISWVIPKKKNLVIVGEWSGSLRNDNAHTIGLELRKINSNLEVYFITKDKRCNGDGVLYIHCFKSIIAHMRAKTFIVGSGKEDVIKYLITKKSILINTWHGVPIKKIHFLVKKKSVILSIRDRVMPYFCERPDYILAEPGFEMIMHDGFLPRKGVISIHQPKWLNVERRKSSHKYLVYAPTFRDENKDYLPVTVHELDEIEAILNKKQNIKFLIYLHPACTFRPTKKYKNIKFNGYDCQYDLYGYSFGAAVVIISDVSGTLIEADRIGVPYECYFPDEVDYIRKSRQVISSVYDIYCSKKIHNIVKFVENIDSYDKLPVLKFDRNQIKEGIKCIANLISAE